MSTRSIVGVYTSDDPSNKAWHGRYCHFDGYPTGVGATLHSEYQRVYRFELPENEITDGRKYDPKGVANLVEYLMYEKVGWSVLAGADLSMKPGWMDRCAMDWPTLQEYSASPEGKRPQCYSARGETPGDPVIGDLLTSEDTDTWCEYAYIFNIRAMTMDVWSLGYKAPNKLLATVDLNGEANFEQIEKDGHE